MPARGEPGIGFLFHWQVPLCGLAIFAPAVMSVKWIKTAPAEPLLYSHLWSNSCCRKLNPVWLCLYRTFAFICLARILVEILAEDGAFAFYFYTQWTFALVMVYFGLGTIVSVHGCWIHSTRIDSPRRELEESAPMNTSSCNGQREISGGTKSRNGYSGEEEAGFFGYLMQVVYQTSAGAVVLTDIVFWCIIVPFLSTKPNWLMGSMHTLNVLFLLIDTGLNSLPFPWFRLSYFVIWSSAYVLFQWVIHACGFTWWPYPFLVLNEPWAPLWYFTLAVAHIPCYGIYALIVKAKNTILRRPNVVLRSN